MRQFRYVLLLMLAFMGIAMLVYSQEAVEEPKDAAEQSEDATEKSDQQPKDAAEQSEDATEKSDQQPKDAAEQSDEQPNPTEQTTKEPDSLETQIKVLKEEMKGMKQSIDAMGDSINNPFQIYINTFLSLIVLIFVVLYLLIMRNIREMRNRFESSEQRWKSRLYNSEQRWDGQLKLFRPQIKEITEKLAVIESNCFSIRNEQTNLKNALSKFGTRLDEFNSILANVDSDNVSKKPIEDQSELAAIVQETQERIESLAQAYKNGEPIDFFDIENPTPSQKVMLILNSIASNLGKWKIELEQSETVDPEFYQIITSAERDIKNRLQSIRAESSPTPISIDMDTFDRTDVYLNYLRSQCFSYVEQFERTLTENELRYEVNEDEYNQYIPQFIRYRLFNEVADFVPFENLPENLNIFLGYLGYDVVPIEIGKTKADAREHDIKESQKSSNEPGTIIEVVLPGLQRIEDGKIVQRPVVIRGE